MRFCSAVDHRAQTSMAEPIRTWHDLQGRVVELLERLNADQQLAIGAAANPLLAIEELGYQIDDEARASLADRLRHGPEGTAQLEGLREQIFGVAGHTFDLSSAEAVRHVLVEELGIRAKPFPD